MGDNSSTVTKSDGSNNFSGGVNSIKVTTLASNTNPDGLPRNTLAWLNNATVRDGGITPRAGWQPLGVIHDPTGLYQGGWMYDPGFTLNPYLVLSISGHLYRVNIDGGFSVTDLSAAFGLINPPLEPYGHATQGEEFLVWQAGDAVTLPLFWDGNILRRSIGITNPAVAPGTPGVNEIPAATCMDYYMGRLWYAQGRTYGAGDIVRGASGTVQYQRRDAILNVTENPLVVGGDNFTVPTQAGAIRFLRNNATIDTTTGEGRLLIGTRKNVYSLAVPVTRANWIAADNDNQPLQTVVQLTNGAVNDRSVVPVNGDLYFQSLEPSIRSLASTVRYFSQPGNIPISANEQRILQFNDRALMRYSSGIEFNNRLWQTQLPRQLPQGVVSDAVAPLDFLPISSVGEQRPPVWEGMYEGLQILQLFVGDFGGLERAFAVVVSQEDSSIQLWELTQADRFQNGDNRITMLMETPAWTWARHGWETDLKKLVSAKIWVDRLYGTAVFTLKYRPDGATCWIDWMTWKECSAKNSAEDANNPITYPLIDFGECYKNTMDLPKPPEDCAPCGTGRPAYIAYQHQLQLQVKGFCRVRGIWPIAERVDEKLYQSLVCKDADNSL